MERQAGKLGREKARHLLGTRYGDYVKSGMPVPPEAFDYAKNVSSYPMALNDAISDCTIAGAVHFLQLCYAEVGETFTYPGDEAVKAQFESLGGTDQTGLVVADVLQSWRNSGMFGNKLTAFVEIDPQDTKTLTQACYAFGGIYTGVHMPANAITQFNDHLPWSVDPNNDGLVGGHCIIVSGMGPDGINAITWGNEVLIKWDWWAKYAEETWVLIPEVYVEANHGPIYSIDVVGLEKDLAAL